MKEGDDALAWELVTRSVREQWSHRRVWLDPNLAPRLPRLSLSFVDTPALAEVALVHGSRLGPRGEILGAGPRLPSRVWAWFMPSAGDRVLSRAEGPRRGRAETIVSPLGWIEVRPSGLVVTALAKGVSARDLQSFIEPPLLIDPTVDEMRLESEASGPHDAPHGVA